MEHALSSLAGQFRLLGVVPFINDTQGFQCEQVFGTDYDRSVALKFSVLACYLVVFLVAIFQFLRIHRLDPVKEMTPQKLFHVILCIVNCSTFRALHSHSGCIPIPCVFCDFSSTPDSSTNTVSNV